MFVCTWESECDGRRDEYGERREIDPGMLPSPKVGEVNVPIGDAYRVNDTTKKNRSGERKQPSLLTLQ